MNDFTKEELETLAACVSIYAKDDPDDYLPLFDKICAQINTYCEHEWNGIRYAAVRLRSTDDREHQYKCSKCNKVLFEY